MWEHNRRHLLLRVCGVPAQLGPGALEIGYWLEVRRTRRGVGTPATATLSELALATAGLEDVPTSLELR